MGSKQFVYITAKIKVFAVQSCGRWRTRPKKIEAIIEDPEISDLLQICLCPRQSLFVIYYVMAVGDADTVMSSRVSSMVIRSSSWGCSVPDLGYSMIGVALSLEMARNCTFLCSKVGVLIDKWRTGISKGLLNFVKRQVLWLNLVEQRLYQIGFDVRRPLRRTIEINILLFSKRLNEEKFTSFHWLSSWLQTPSHQWDICDILTVYALWTT